MLRFNEHLLAITDTKKIPVLTIEIYKPIHFLGN